MTTLADPCDECARGNCVHCGAMFGGACGCSTCHREGLRQCLERLDNIVHDIKLHADYVLRKGNS